MGDIVVVVDVGDDNCCCGGEQQGRDLRYQVVVDGYQYILLEGSIGVQVVFEDFDIDVVDQVDCQNYYFGDGVFVYKF